MKKRIALAAVLMLPLASVFAQYGETKPLISVSGSAEVKVVPDEIDLQVGVETLDRDLQAAKKQNDDSVSAALDFLKQKGVPEKNVKTDFISIEPVYPDSDSVRIDPTTGKHISGKLSLTKPYYYVVRKSISIMLTNVGSFDDVLSGLVTNGVNTVQGIDFRTSELRKYRDKAWTMAVQAAKEKADAMAATLGVKVGKPFGINENDFGGYRSWNGNNWQQALYQNGMNASQNGGGEAESDEGTISVGQISVSANVSVSFLIK
jgi:hypothetical protein